MIKSKRLTALSLAALVAIAVGYSIHYFHQNLVYRVNVIIQVDQGADLVLSSVSRSGERSELDRLTLESGPGEVVQSSFSQSIKKPLNLLRLELEPHAADKAMKVKLHNIHFDMVYAKNVSIMSHEINTRFTIGDREPHVGNYYELSAGESIVWLSKESISDGNRWITLLLPCFFFVGIFCIVSGASWSRIPAFSDMSLGGHISSHAEFNTINGIRGLAAILVLLSHTAPGWESLWVGLSLLFVISGFLLTKPFVLDHTRIYSFKVIEVFWTKRLKRILPMYYLFVFITYGLTFQFDTLLRHLLFIEAGGHLWPMTQIFAFYMLLPLVLILTSGLAKLHKIAPIIVLIGCTYWYFALASTWKPFFNGHYYQSFYLYAFLIGVLTSYLQYGFIKPFLDTHPTKEWVNQLIGLSALVFTITFVLWSAPMKPDAIIFKYVSQFYVKCIACSLIIVLALNTRKTVYNYFINNWLFRSVGIVGFSFYLLHSLGMNIFDQFSAQYFGQVELDDRSWTYTVGAFIVTYFMALLAYSYVERPFFGRQRLDEKK